ncbi:hypothetical protein QE152_g31023 [Popillia japonica]|uniref:Double jelly roll-like domain-containing protein n=1 Tax=Popillia japonica TaxID=7064 RepID=A0AAW1JCU2_POPJA
MDTLDIFQGLQFNEAITKKQLHTYYPRVSNFKTNPRVSNFKTSDEIRISIQHQDVYTLPSESFIYIEGKFKHDAAGTGTCELTNNAYAFLFDQIRYEINGVEVDRCTKPGITSSIKGYISYGDKGITSSIKGYISYGDNETKFLEMAGWCPNSKTQPTISLNNKFNAYIPLKFFLGFAEDYKKIIINANNKFNAYIPLKFFLGFAEDYKKIIINASQELILLRSGNDLNCYHNTNTGGTNTFQTARKDSLTADASKFDHASLTNLKLHLNADSFPYDNMNLQINENKYAAAYRMYASFQSSYYNLQINENKYAAAYRMYASFQSSYYNENSPATTTKIISLC